jgi:hypothetical protein
VGEGVDEDADDAIGDERLGELSVPPVPEDWQSEEHQGLDELTGPEASWLRDRLLALDEVVEGPCLLAKVAELCAELSPRMAPGEESPLRPWDDHLAVQSAKAAGQLDRLELASQASHLGHYVRAIYAALVESIAEATRLPRHDPPLRHYRELLRELAEDRVERTSLGRSALNLPRLRPQGE